MNTEEYGIYLLSAQWRQVAEKRKEIDGHRCVMCGSKGTQTNKLEVHHFSYKRVGNENPYVDLVTLCRNCHRDVHRLMDRITDENGRKGWKDSLPISNHILNNNNY